MIFINLSFEKCLIRITTPHDDLIELNFGRYLLCLCNIRDSVKERFRVGLTGCVTKTHILTLGLGTEKEIEFTIRPNRLVARLDRLCAGRVRDEEIESSFCFFPETHQLLKPVYLHHTVNSYLGPNWAQRDFRVSCVCTAGKIDCSEKDWEESYYKYKNQ